MRHLPEDMIMHEVSIAESLVEMIREIALEEGMLTVETVYVRIGELSCIDPDALQTAFEFVTSRSMIRSAQLLIERVAPRGVCKECGHDYPLEDSFFVSCPKCNAREVNIYQGQEMILDRIEGEGANAN